MNKLFLLLVCCFSSSMLQAQQTNDGAAGGRERAERKAHYQARSGKPDTPDAGVAAAGAQGNDIHLAANPVVLDADILYPFSGGYAVIQKGTAFALIDREGKMVFPYNKYTFQQNGGNKPFDKDPTYIKGMPWHQYGFVRGFCIVQDVATGQWGMLNTRLQFVLPCRFFSIHRFDEQGLAMANTEKGGFMVDTNGKTVAQPVRSFNQGNIHYGWETDAAGISQEYGDFHPVRHYLVRAEIKNASITDLPRYGFADQAGNITIPARFTAAMPFSNGVAAVAIRDEFGKEKWGYIDEQGKQLIDFKFSNKPGNFHHGLARVEPLDQQEFRYAYINKTGTPVIKMKQDGDCQYATYAVATNGIGYPERGYKQESTFHDGYALWRKDCRGNDNASGVMVMDTTGAMFRLGDRVIEHGWLGRYYLLTDFIGGEALICSNPYQRSYDKTAVITIQGDIIVQTAPGNDQGRWSGINTLFDPVSGLASGFVGNSQSMAQGYVGRDGTMRIIKGAAPKW